MKVKILNLNKTETKSVDLPVQFCEPVRIDIIQKAFLAIQANTRQPYGAHPEAGKRASAELSRRRKKYRGSYGAGISRVPRKIMSRRGTRMNWVGAFAPGTVGGRRAHPPKAEKIWSQKINKTENRKAIRSAIAATVDADLVKGRGHVLPHGFPFIVADNINQIKKTKELANKLSYLGFKEELIKTKENNKKGLLIVTTDNTLRDATSNITGFETVNVKDLNVQLLAPGGVPGRLTLFTQSAITELSDKKLFTQNYKGETEVKEKIVVEKVAPVKKITKVKAKPKIKVQKKLKSTKAKK